MGPSQPLERMVQSHAPLYPCFSIHPCLDVNLWPPYSPKVASEMDDRCGAGGPRSFAQRFTIFLSCDLLSAPFLCVRWSVKHRGCYNSRCKWALVGWLPSSPQDTLGKKWSVLSSAAVIMKKDHYRPFLWTTRANKSPLLPRKERQRSLTKMFSGFCVF